MANLLSAESDQSPITTRLLAFACFLDSFWRFVRTSANGQSSTRQTPAQVTCAHCQRSSGTASAPEPFWSSPKCPTEPHIIQSFSGTSTPCEGLFSFPAEGLWQHPSARPRIVHGNIGFGKGVRQLDAQRALTDCPRIHMESRKCVQECC